MRQYQAQNLKDPDETGADIKENEDSDTDSEDINTLAENDSDETGSDNGAQDDKPTPTAIQPLTTLSC